MNALLNTLQTKYTVNTLKDVHKRFGSCWYGEESFEVTSFVEEEAYNRVLNTTNALIKDAHVPYQMVLSLVRHLVIVNAPFKPHTTFNKSMLSLLVELVVELIDVPELDSLILSVWYEGNVPEEVPSYTLNLLHVALNELYLVANKVGLTDEEVRTYAKTVARRYRNLAV